MTESKICTCPSGDGSLRWPCPKHPAVEQAGGDERAAFKTAYLAEFDCDADGDDNMAHSNTAWRAWKMARAALAHRAPEVCSECSDTGKVYDESGDGPWSCYACTGNPEVIGYANGDELDNMLDDRTAVLSPGKTSFHTVPVYRLIRAALAQPSPAQAEAERPGVGARVVHSNPVVLGQCGPLNANDELMTVAQHAASVARWAEMFNRVEQERDAALARIAELETALEPFAAVADAYDDSGDDDHEPYTDMGCDDRLRLTLGQHRAARTALSGAPAQAQHSVPEVSGIGRDFAYPRSVVLYLRTEPTDDDLRAIHDGLRSLAAAPGKEGV